MMKMQVLFDLDGTLADITHRLPLIQGPEKQWSRFFAECVHDAPIEHGMKVLNALRDAGHEIIIVTGRSDEVRNDTEFWLSERLGWVPRLIMRKSGDYRSDHELKQEWLNNGMIEKEQVLLAFEDRSRVVAMYREQGIPCYQVAPGDF